MGLVFSTRPVGPVADKGNKRELDSAAAPMPAQDTTLLQLSIELDELRRQFYAFVSASNRSDERGSY